MHRFLASLESLALQARRSPTAGLIVLLGLGLGPLLGAFQRYAPIGEPDTTVAELSTLLLVTLTACWSLHHIAGMDPIRRVEALGQRTFTDALLAAVCALVVLGLAGASLGYSGLEIPMGAAVWACVKLGALAFGMRYATRCPASMLLVVAWGAPQLGLTPVSAAVGLQTTPQIPIEALYLCGLTLLALAAPQKRASS